MTPGLTRRQALQALAWASPPCLIAVSEQAARAASGATAGDYVGVIGDISGGRIALSSDGRHVLVYVCNGTDTDPATLARWTRGETTAGALRVAANGITLVAQLQGDRASGTLTLPDGRSHRFLAGSRMGGQAVAGLYRSEARFNGVAYVGGWIINPNRHTASGPERPSVHPVSWSVLAPAGRADLGRPQITRVDDLDELFEDFAKGAGAIVNQQTGAVLPYVAPNFATMTADVPGLGTFRLHRCVQTKCT